MNPRSCCIRRQCWMWIAIGQVVAHKAESSVVHSNVRKEMPPELRRPRVGIEQPPQRVRALLQLWQHDLPMFATNERMWLVGPTLTLHMCCRFLKAQLTVEEHRATVRASNLGGFGKSSTVTCIDRPLAATRRCFRNCPLRCCRVVFTLALSSGVRCCRVCWRSLSRCRCNPAPQVCVVLRRPGCASSACTRAKLELRVSRWVWRATHARDERLCACSSPKPLGVVPEWDRLGAVVPVRGAHRAARGRPDGLTSQRVDSGVLVCTSQCTRRPPRGRSFCATGRKVCCWLFSQCFTHFTLTSAIR